MSVFKDKSCSNRPLQQAECLGDRIWHQGESLVLQMQHEQPKGLVQVSSGALRTQGQSGFLADWSLEEVMQSGDSRLKDITQR